jgi:hypothetical protein
LSSPLAIEFLRAGYRLPAFAFLEPDFLELDLVEPDFDFWVDFELGFERDLAPEPDFELAVRDLELAGRDFAPLELDFDLLAPDFAPPELDFDLLALDFEPPEPDLDPLELDFLLELDFELLELLDPPRLGLDSESDSVGGGSGGLDTGSMRRVSSLLTKRGGGSRWALSIPMTSGTAP